MASELLRETLSALNYLHSQNPPIIHRDIKPQNILIKEHAHGFVKISDFRLAVYHDPKSLSHSQGRGTERYMSPEVKSGRRYSPSADVYSMGVVIQEMFNFDINTIGHGPPDAYGRTLLRETIVIKKGITCKICGQTYGLTQKCPAIRLI
ncbi:unnamed protein product [Oppiella nova]|uniref:Protein kinase domain-containing protein n=1 Tax=Oppiella nova TaxID=334625 RepID=A0A7R9LY51_9ACAR|nr:unnamed protein product [Oppiella nova]CAG2168077.1 unnamed protein product [Oppiella nova]